MYDSRVSLFWGTRLFFVAFVVRDLTMGSDFFLQNRSHQLVRLCSSEASVVPSIPAATRAKLPAELREFLALIDRVCKVASTKDEADSFGDAQRRDIEEFERSIVRLRFSSNELAKKYAVQLIRAIFGDAEYFSGLKPLPQYTDAFAYELLFPSWLNLLKACMLPSSANGRPRLDGQRQAVLFEFLGKINAAKHVGEESLVAFLTFVASRFDAPVCEELLQRFIELYAKEGSSLLEAIEFFNADCKDARHLTERLQDYLTVKHSLCKWPAQSEFPISYKRPRIRVLPRTIARLLAEMDLSRTDWHRFFNIARPLRLLVNSDHLLTNEYTSILERFPDEIATLLGLVIQSNGKATTFLSNESQVCLALLIENEAAQGASLNIDRVAAFAKTMAPRLEGYSDLTLGYFCRQFISDEKNRSMLLDACSSEVMRSQLGDFVLQSAGRTDDDKRFLELLCCVTVISPESNMDAAKCTLRAIDAVVQNRTIGNKEFVDLVSDLQENVDDAIDYLATPIMAAAGKSPRLASLYMTLNEISETFAASGKADNFSVVRAKYSALTNFDDS